MRWQVFDLKVIASLFFFGVYVLIFQLPLIPGAFPKYHLTISSAGNNLNVKAARNYRTAASMHRRKPSPAYLRKAQHPPSE
jgi:hypothetical protein